MAESTENIQETKENRGNRKRVSGIVASAKMDKTIKVRITNLYRHPRYKKYVKRITTLKAHDENNEAREGDEVEIMECRPLSKTKNWRLVEILERAPKR